MLSWAVKNSRTRVAAAGDGVKSAVSGRAATGARKAGLEGDVGIRV